MVKAQGLTPEWVNSGTPVKISIALKDMRCTICYTQIVMEFVLLHKALLSVKLAPFPDRKETIKNMLCLKKRVWIEQTLKWM